jgi:hypothetical protein
MYRLATAQVYVFTLYTSTANLTAYSNCDFALFCPQGTALVVSRPIALL